MIPRYVFVVRIEHDVGRPLIPLTVLVGRHRAPRRLPGLTVHARAWHAVGYGRHSDGCALSSLGIGLQAIQPWPYRAGLAAPRPGRLQTATASLTCYFSLPVSRPGKSGDPRTSLRVHPDCVGDTTKRLTAHTGLASFPGTRLSSDLVRGYGDEVVAWIERWQSPQRISVLRRFFAIVSIHAGLVFPRVTRSAS